MTEKALFIALLAAMTFWTVGVGPAAFDRPAGGTIVGRIAGYPVAAGESLLEIARRHSIGYRAIVAANPGVDPFVPDPQTVAVLPTEWILPEAPFRRGIVINRAEMRLYLYRDEEAREVESFAIGVGDPGTDTPLGRFTIVEKIKAPSWYVPKSIKRERPYLPPVVPPGPDNPMGSHALRLSLKSVLIHGTNRPWGIGMRNTHGCIRLYPEEIVRLYDSVEVGTPVAIVDQPVKAASEGDSVYLQVYDDDQDRDLFDEALKVLAEKGLVTKVDMEKVGRAVTKPSGLLVDVAKHPPRIPESSVGLRPAAPR